MSDTASEGLQLEAAQIRELMLAHFPKLDERLLIEAVAPMRSTIRLHDHPSNLRPGGTVSGPALMTLADTGAYVAILALVGPKLLAVTSNLNINFLKRPRPGDIVAETTLLRLGRRLAVGEVHMYGADDPEPVAQATVTYALPSED